ncbi:MAG: EAL domain-containing protein [Desertifilum sp.]|nr:EAL domain-containing protein [Desertifilum sp.]
MDRTTSSTILLIDSDPSDLQIVLPILSSAGYGVTVVTHESGAIESLLQELPVLILLQVSSVQEQGLSLCRTIREFTEFQAIPVIFIVEADDTDSIVKGISLGAVDYLTRPLDSQTLLRQVQFHIRLNAFMFNTQEQTELLTKEVKGCVHIESQLLKLLLELERRVEERNSQLSIVLNELQRTQQELLAREQKLRHTTFHDALTGLPNRRWLMEYLPALIQSANQNPRNHFAALSIDLDRFKTINDSLGHIVGDELLRNVALRLQASLSPMSTVARLGGDEFIVLMEQIESIQDAIALAQQIQIQFQLPFQINDYEIFMGASVGITLSIIGYQSPVEVLRDAGIAMSQAKQAGHGCYQVLTPERKARAIARLQLETDLRQAVERQEFYLEYQPIYGLATGELKGFEALVRWQHPSRGRVAPTEFIPTAEEIGIIDRIGIWVLKEATRQLSHWQQEFPNIPLVMHVNLSAKQLKQRELVQQIEAFCTEMRLSHNSLKLEITESCFLESSSEEINLLHQLRDKGIRLCIDDFGIGYSSLGRLQNFPMDTVKVDRSFVKRLGKSSRETEIVHTIVNLAHNLGLDLVAEGIETAEQLQTLQQLGYEQGQGYYFSRPLNSHLATQLVMSSAFN